MDCIIIGGGACGLAAAVSAGRRGRSVLILERMPRAGKKLLATGNGRCNLLNRSAPRYYGDAGFALQTLEKCPREKLERFLLSVGVPVVYDGEDRGYPACGQASAVLSAFLLHAAHEGAEILPDSAVVSLSRQNGQYEAVTSDGRKYRAPRALVCGGGRAQQKLGSDGSAYPLLTALGHSLVSPSPALVPLTARKEDIKGLSGLRAQAILTLRTHRAAGEVLFTDDGVSGICAMQLSRFAREGDTLFIDFSPYLGLVPRAFDAPAQEDHAPLIERFLLRRAEELPGFTGADYLTGLLPRPLIERFSSLSIAALARALASFPVRLRGTRGFDFAQVTAGGIDARDFSPDTMESRLSPGLFAAGEILNVDGDCGGFNLMFALAGGVIAGERL